jgi:hypothetical protein
VITAGAPEAFRDRVDTQRVPQACIGIEGDYAAVTTKGDYAQSSIWFDLSWASFRPASPLSLAPPAANVFLCVRIREKRIVVMGSAAVRLPHVSGSRDLDGI